MNIKQHSIRLALLWICTFHFGLFTAAQQVNLDSLWTIWQGESEPDTNRLSALQKISWDGYLFSQPDSAFYFAQLQFDFAQRKGLKKQMAGALNTQGTSFHVRGDYPKALDYYHRSLKIMEEVGDKRGMSSSLNNIGNLLINQGDYPKALDYHQRGLKIREEIGNKEFIASSLNNIGIIYYYQGDYPKTLDYYQRSLKIMEEIGNKLGVANTLNNIGSIYKDQHEYPIALDYCQRGLKISEEIEHEPVIANSLGNIGAVYSDQGDYAKALDYYHRSLKIMEKIGDKPGTATVLNNIGNIYKMQSDYPRALDYHQRSLKVSEEIGDKYGIATSLNTIGGDYQKQGDHQKAIAECSKGLQLAQEIGAIYEQKSACQCLYEAYKGRGNGNKALEYHEQMLVLDDSLKAEETTKQLERMEFQKQILADSIAKAEEARLIEEIHQEEIRRKNQTRNWTMAGGILALLLAGGFYSRWRYVRKAKAVLQVEKDRSENLLLNILPTEIAEELKAKGQADARDFDMVSILFTDFKEFTQTSEKLSAQELVEEINICFKAFDSICGKYDIEKIKTIGDSYMAAGGLPIPDESAVKNTVMAALDMQQFMINRKAELDKVGKIGFDMRAGIHTGPVVAGIVGVKKFQYDIWGNTVNTANRMESAGEVGKVNISHDTYVLIKDDPQFTFESRGKIEAKGKGELEMYFVSIK